MSSRPYTSNTAPTPSVVRVLLQRGAQQGSAAARGGLSTAPIDDAVFTYNIPNLGRTPLRVTGARLIQSTVTTVHTDYPVRVRNLVIVEPGYPPLTLTLAGIATTDAARNTLINALLATAGVQAAPRSLSVASVTVDGFAGVHRLSSASGSAMVDAFASDSLLMDALGFPVNRLVRTGVRPSVSPLGLAQLKYLANSRTPHGDRDTVVAVIPVSNFAPIATSTSQSTGGAPFVPIDADNSHTLTFIITDPYGTSFGPRLRQAALLMELRME